MPRRYPVAFRRKVLDLIEAGNPVAEIAAQLAVSNQKIYKWRNQDQIDRGPSHHRLTRSITSDIDQVELTPS